MPSRSFSDKYIVDTYSFFSRTLPLRRRQIWAYQFCAPDKRSATRVAQLLDRHGFTFVSAERENRGILCTFETIGIHTRKTLISQIREFEGFARRFESVSLVSYGAVSIRKGRLPDIRDKSGKWTARKTPKTITQLARSMPKPKIVRG